MGFSGLPQGQESQEKLRKMIKVRKKLGVFEEWSGNLSKLKKTSDFVSPNIQNSLFSRAFKW